MIIDLEKLPQVCNQNCRSEYYIQKVLERTVNFISSETYKNMMQALADELMVSTKYALYSGKAYEDGYVQIGDIFSESSGHEREHAEMLMKFINGGSLPDTLNNLKEAYSGENNEWTRKYSQFADMADKEGFDEIAELFRNIAVVEKHHDYRFRNLADNIENDNVFCRDKDSLWVCLNCGFLYEGMCAPEDRCPLCGEHRGYYKLNCEDY